MQSQQLMPSANGTTALGRYDQMCHAIALAYEVDEVKAIRDQALALEIYASQARNVEAERQACEIRLRAERKAGDLLRQMNKAKGGRPTENQSHAATGLQEDKTLADLGVSKTQSSRWQQLAEIPDDQFEAAVTDAAAKPSTASIIAAAHAEPKRDAVEPKRDAVDPLALWVWGRMLDFERQGLLDTDPNALLTTMLPHMRQTVRGLAPRLAAWIGEIR